MSKETKHDDSHVTLIYTIFAPLKCQHEGEDPMCGHFN